MGGSDVGEMRSQVALVNRDAATLFGQSMEVKPGLTEKLLVFPEPDRFRHVWHVCEDVPQARVKELMKLAPDFHHVKVDSKRKILDKTPIVYPAVNSQGQQSRVVVWPAGNS